MATDPNQDPRIDIDLSDVDLTDELPVLVETAVFESDKRLIAVDEDDEREHTASVLALSPDDSGAEGLKKDGEQSAAKIAALEREVATLSQRSAELEDHLKEKEAALGSLTLALQAARSALAERREIHESLAAEIADRDLRIARLLEKAEPLRKQAADARTELERLRQEREIEGREIATLRAELQTRVSSAGGGPVEVELREQLDTLTAYISNRRTWWDALEARAAEQAARIAELQSQLAERPVTAAKAAVQETPPAAETSNPQLAAQRRPTGAQESDPKLTERVDSAALKTSLERATAELARARAETAQVQRERDQARAALAALQRERSDPGRPAESTGAAADLEAARRQAADARAQVEQQRAASAKLEQALAEKDRALAAREERIRTLQTELQRRLGALERVSAADVTGKGLASKTPDPQRTDVPQRIDAARESANTPTLICLTSDGPRPFALAKGTITIGRSSDCDIQILTHFVSREHARLTVSPRGGVLIEDLGSTNGVFVNSVRVDRQELHHGDLVTVGESQFRFLETMAH